MGGVVAMERMRTVRGTANTKADGTEQLWTAPGFRQWIIAQSIVAIGSVGIGLTTFVARLVFVQIYPESSA